MVRLRNWEVFGLAMGILVRLHIGRVKAMVRPNSGDQKKFDMV